MYKLKTIQKTLALLKKYDYQIEKTARETGIKSRTIKSWYDKERKGLPLLISPRNKLSKFTPMMRKEVIDYYFEHGQSASRACRHFGYPARTTLIEWIKKDRRFEGSPPLKPRKKGIKISKDEKKNIVIESVSSKQPVKDIATKYNTTREVIYAWQKEITGVSMNRTKKGPETINNLMAEVERLRIEHQRLDIENKILKKANEILKKDMGTDYDGLTNREKTQIISALSQQYAVKILSEKLNIAKSTYFYSKKALEYDKYEKDRLILKRLFQDNYSTFGYRRMRQALKIETGVIMSEKVIRRLMKEESLVVYVPKLRKYISYKGEITPSVPNVLNRDFNASQPYEKTVTDITEFGLRDGKVYLSPLIDCFTGVPITWKIGKAPTSELTNSMLLDAYEQIGKQNMIVHSDRGFHYRLDTWINRMNDYGYIRSMSKKGCSPDNAACEGFFGTLKKEFFYPRDWRLVTSDEFTNELEKYLDWFVNKRIKRKLNYLSPKAFMLNYLQTV